MSTGFLALLAFSPILLAAILLVGLRWPAKRAMPLVYLLTAGVGLFAWEMSFNPLLHSLKTLLNNLLCLLLHLLLNFLFSLFFYFVTQ